MLFLINRYKKIKMEIPLNLVEDDELLLNKGDALVVIGREDKLQLIIVCPGCGKTSASAGGHVYNPKTKSYHPSIVHNKDLGGCGWHGWLTNGIFKECWNKLKNLLVSRLTI